MKPKFGTEALSLKFNECKKLDSEAKCTPEDVLDLSIYRHLLEAEMKEAALALVKKVRDGCNKKSSMASSSKGSDSKVDEAYKKALDMFL